MIGRCIVTHSSDPPFLMALDETFLDQAATDDHAGPVRQAPVLHCYRKSPSISLGYFSRVEDEVDIEACREQGVGIFRRTSGGGTIYEDRDQHIYGLILPHPGSFGVPSGTLDSFRFLNRAVVGALGDLGFPVEYVPVNDILINGRKVSGCAQTRRKGSLLQHGTIIIRHDPEVMFRFLKVSPRKLREKALSDPALRVTSLERESRNLPGVRVPDPEKVVDGLRKGFSSLLGIDFHASNLSSDELELAEELASSRYRTDAWNFRR